MLLLDKVVALLTFPGVIAHEVAHRIICDFFNVPVYRISYFQLGNQLGFVEHGQSTNLSVTILITAFPLIFNTILATVLSSAISIPVLTLRCDPSELEVTLMWIALALGMHAMPSKTDLDILKAQMKLAEDRETLAMRIAILFTVFGDFTVLSRVIWIDFWYAALVFGLSGTLIASL